MGHVSKTTTPAGLRTVREVADVLRVDPRTVRRLVAAGELAGVRVGPKSLRISPESLAAFLERKAA